MAKTHQSTTTPDDEPGARLPEGVRTLISLLLFVHLFALGLVFFSNFEGGDWDSELLGRMKTVVRPYLYPLWLDRPYHNHLTYGHDLDFDHYLEVAITANGSAGETLVRLPEVDLGLGQRRDRHERLAWHFARRVEMQIPDELLPLSIGAGILKQNDASRAQIRCLRKQPLFLDDVLAGTKRETPDERVYAADVFFLPGYDQPQLNKIGEARDVAPVIRSSVGGSQEPAQRSEQKSGEQTGATPDAGPVTSPRSFRLPSDDAAPPALPPPLPPTGK